MRERDIEKYFVNAMTLLGHEVRKVKWIGRTGAPDRLVMMPGGKLLWVELKAPGAALRPGQRREHDRMIAKGQWVEVIDSMAGVDDLVAYLNG